MWSDRGPSFGGGNDMTLHYIIIAFIIITLIINAHALFKQKNLN